MSWLLLGASRGLGAAFSEILKQHSEKFSVISRTAETKMDFSKQEEWTRVLEKILQLNPQRIIYFAGGGPYGKFAEKKWQDHEWAFNVNFAFPSFLIHQLQVNHDKTSLQQLGVVGSAIAESKPDPMAASYAAAKHGLCGLITSLQLEGSIHYDLRLFSPGYMDTKILPPNAWPRQREGLVQEPLVLAKALHSWLLDQDKKNSHLVSTIQEA